jgi:NADPH:quinone reductase-like Zn-dependent oxidoreductase
MKAIVFTNYGLPGVLQLKEIDKPVPADNELLIKIIATAVNSADWRIRKADPFGVRLFFGLTKPKKQILGGVLSGVIEAVGNNVSRFKIGDQVFGSAGISFGAYAEYICLPDTAIITIKPGNITHEEAATITFGGLTALYFLRKAEIKPSQRILIIGASGAVGTASVQLAKHFGALVTGVCSTENLDLVKALGADYVIEYTKEDFAQKDHSYDVVFDTVNKAPVKDCIKSLSKNGILILSAAGLNEMMQGIWASKTKKIKVIMGVCKETQENLSFLKDLIEAGKYKPVIDKTYSLEEMSEAHSYVELGHKKGNVAVMV